MSATSTGWWRGAFTSVVRTWRGVVADKAQAGKPALDERVRATWPGTASWRSYFGDRRQAPADRHQT